MILGADEVSELKIIFAEVCAECREMHEDLNEKRIQSCFDSFFVTRNTGRDIRLPSKSDIFRQDYSGIGGKEIFSEGDSKNVWKRLTKDELFIAVRQCICVYQLFIALRQRYGRLKSAVGLLHDQDIGYLPMAKEMEEAYEKAEKASDRFSDQRCKEVQELDSILYHMPRKHGSSKGSKNLIARRLSMPKKLFYKCIIESKIEV